MGSNRNRETTFHFKQFDIVNCQSAMKVGTDGVLLGAWAEIPNNSKLVLDVGCGTGLIALMIAQRAPKVHVTAIDINQQAVDEARLNAQNSTFADRISISQYDYKEFIPAEKFDLIVCNPPFFTETLHSPDQARAAARHEDSLSTTVLMRHSAELLADNGHVAIIAPTIHDSRIELEAALAGLHPHRCTHITTVSGKPPKRTLWDFSKKCSPLLCSELCIKDIAGNFSQEYKQLVEDFYLNF